MHKFKFFYTPVFIKTVPLHEKEELIKVCKAHRLNDNFDGYDKGEVDNRNLTSHKGYYSDPFEPDETDMASELRDITSRLVAEIDPSSVLVNFDFTMTTQYDTIYFKENRRSSWVANYFLVLPKTDFENKEIRLHNPNSLGTPYYEKIVPRENMLVITPAHLMYDVLPDHTKSECICIRMYFEEER